MNSSHCYVVLSCCCDVDKELQTNKRNEQMQLNVDSWVTLFSFQMQSKLSVSLKPWWRLFWSWDNNCLYFSFSPANTTPSVWPSNIAWHSPLGLSTVGNSSPPPFLHLFTLFSLPAVSNLFLIQTEEKDTFRFYVKFSIFKFLLVDCLPRCQDFCNPFFFLLLFFYLITDTFVKASFLMVIPVSHW